MKSNLTQADLLEERIKRIEKSTKKALKLQAKEYRRRLDGLNGEADKLHTMQETYLPREVFDRTVAPLVEYVVKQQGRSQMREYIPWAIALAALLWNIIKK